MRRLNWLDWTALTLLVIGGLNWLLIGIFRYDLVAAIFGPLSVVSRIVYILVGIAAVYVAFDAFTFAHVPSGQRAGMTGA